MNTTKAVDLAGEAADAKTPFQAIGAITSKWYCIESGEIAQESCNEFHKRKMQPHCALPFTDVQITGIKWTA